MVWAKMSIWAKASEPATESRFWPRSEVAAHLAMLIGSAVRPSIQLWLAACSLAADAESVFPKQLHPHQRR